MTKPQCPNRPPVALIGGYYVADLIGSGTEAEAYQRVARERYRLMRTHEWNDEVIEELRRQLRPPRRHAR